MSGSRFVAEFASILQAEKAAVSRFIRHRLGDGGFLARHPKVSRFLAHVPGVSRFLHLPVVAAVPHVAPVYNARARKQRRPMLKL